MTRAIWEVTYERPNGDWVWYRTDAPMTFRSAVLAAIARETNPRYTGAVLVSVNRVPEP